MSYTPEQTYFYTKMQTLYSGNNPGASQAEIDKAAAAATYLIFTLVIPNLKIDLVSGLASFVIPPT